VLVRDQLQVCPRPKAGHQHVPFWDATSPHPSIQNDQIQHSNAYNGGACFSGQPRPHSKGLGPSHPIFWWVGGNKIRNYTTLEICKIPRNSRREFNSGSFPVQGMSRMRTIPEWIFPVALEVGRMI